MRNIVALFFITGLSGCIATEETRVIKIVDPITSIDALTDSGNLSFLPSDDGTIRIEQTFRFNRERPTASSAVIDGTLQLRGACPIESFVCSVDFVVYAPVDVSLVATTQSGNIESLDIEGPLTLTSNSGNIEASGAINTVDVIVDSGNIDLTSITGDTTATTQSGNITLTDITGELLIESSSGNITFDTITGDVSATARSGDIRGDDLSSESFEVEVNSGNVELAFESILERFSAFVGSGNVELTLPVSQYQLELQADSGNVSINGLSDDITSSRLISVETNSGNISVTGR